METPPKPITVMGIVEELKKSSGFVLFVSYAVRQENGDVILENRYMRQQFVPEDLQKMFENFNGLVVGDLKNAAVELVKAAEAIANMKKPTESTQEHEGAKDSDA